MVSRNINSLSLERTYAIAQDFSNCLANGSLSESVVVASQARIDKLLADTPQYPVYPLDQDTLQRHSQLAIAKR